MVLIHKPEIVEIHILNLTLYRLQEYKNYTHILKILYIRNFSCDLYFANFSFLNYLRVLEFVSKYLNIKLE